MKIITLCLFFIIRIFISLILIVNCTGSSLGDVLHATNKDEVINPQNDLINSHKKHYSNLKDGNVLEDSLSCHYPFSHLYRWPIKETSYEIACTQEVEAFEFGDFYTGEEITINEQTGVLTIFPNENPIDIMKVIVVYSKEVVFQFSISIDGNNDMIIPGLHYNYTSYSQYNCHDSFINPEIPIIDNIYTPSFYGYKDINDISILFPNLNFIIPFTFYLSWNMTITEDNDYIFYISNYDTVELYIDDIKVIYEYKICSKEIFTINGTIHLNKGNHQVLAFTESYSDSYNNYIYLIYYGKVNTPIDRFPLPTTYYDNNFKPVLELTSDKYYYSLELNSYVRINLYVNEGNRIKCSCLEQLPNGLNFNFDYTKIEGIPTIIQEVELYHISCRNVYSITNYIEISIEIKGGYRNGLLAYYTKAKMNFDEECKTIYDIDDDNNNEEKGEILVSRHEYSLNHSVTAIGRFSDLPIDMNGEFSLIMNGFIRFRRKGNYSLKITNSDTFLLKIGRGINIFNAKCQNITNSIYYYYIKDGLYPFVLKYTNNYFIPHIDIDIELYGNEVRYDLYYISDMEIEYNYTVNTYTFNQTITPNIILNPPNNITQITIIPNLPHGLKINELTGEITGIPLIENMNKTKYTVVIEAVNTKYVTFIYIIIKTFINPNSFYVHDCITGIDFYNNQIPIFKQGIPIDFEIFNKIGEVSQYIVYNEIPGLKIDTKNSHLRINGIVNSKYNEIEIYFKAIDNNHHSGKGKALIKLDPFCKENNKRVHIFTFISQYEENSMKLTIFDIKGIKIDSIEMNYYMNETYLCLVPSDYIFNIDNNNTFLDFELNLTVDGQILFNRKYQKYKTYNEIVKTKYQNVTIKYNNGSKLYLKQYENFILLPNITGFISEFLYPSYLSDTVHFDYKTGKIWGYYINTGNSYTFITAKGFDGSFASFQLQVEVKKNLKELDCFADSKIPIEFIYHIEDIEISKYMSISMSKDSDNREIYSSNGYYTENYNNFICINDDDYTIHLYDTNPELKGWKNNYITLKMNKIEYGKYTVEELEHFKNIVLPLHPYLHSNILWSYSFIHFDNYYQYDTKLNWKYSLFNDIYKTTTNTIYIRKYFNFNRNSSYVSTLISFNYLSGIIVYVNGRELFRKNLPNSGYIDEYTQATDYNDVITNVKFIIPLDILKYETTLIAVELHKHKSELKYPHFNMTVDLLDDNSNNYGCTNLEDYSGYISDYYPKDRSLYNTNVENVFSNNNNYWITCLPDNFKESNDNIKIDYNFGENNYFYPNVLLVKSYAEDDDEKYTINSLPKSIEIQGRNSTTISNYTLSSIDDLELKEKKSTKYIRFYNNRNGFNTIRINISKVNDVIDNQMNINKFKLLTCRNNTCPSLGNLPETMSGEIITVLCSNDKSKSKTFECMNGINPKWKEIENNCEEKPMILDEYKREIIISKNEYISVSIGRVSGNNLQYSSTPELPECLQLINGVIKGKCSKIMDKTYYDIVVNNDFGEIRILKMIIIKEPNYPVINMNNNNITLKSGVLYKDKKLFNISGYNISFLIEPKLPNGIELKCNGLINGILYDEIENKEYLLTIRNENMTLYFPIFLTSKLIESPNLISIIKTVNLYYGIFYHKLSLFNVYGQNLSFINQTVLPGEILLNENTGLLAGKVSINSIERNDKMIIRIKTDDNNNTYIDMNIDYVIIKEPIKPILLSYLHIINVRISENISFSTGNVIGKNLSFSINNLPNGLKMNNKTGEISGITLDTSNLQRKCTINVINSNGYISYDIILLLIYPNKPIIIEIHKRNVFIPAVDLVPFTLVKAIGDNITYKIQPNLPNGIEFINSNGIIYGKTIELSNKTSYLLIIENNGGESITEYIDIKIDKIYCKSDGKWPETLVGETAEIKCKVKGTEKRKCYLIDGKGKWGDEVESNCYGITNGVLVVIILTTSIFVIGIVLGVIYYFKCIKKKYKLVYEEYLIT